MITSIFRFGDIVIVEENLVGVVVKSWKNDTFEIYVRSFNDIREYILGEVKPYIHHKELSEDDLQYYK